MFGLYCELGSGTRGDVSPAGEVLSSDGKYPTSGQSPFRKEHPASRVFLAAFPCPSFSHTDPLRWAQCGTPMPGLRPRTPGEPSGRAAWWNPDRRGCRLVVVLTFPARCRSAVVSVGLAHPLFRSAPGWAAIAGCDVFWCTLGGCVQGQPPLHRMTIEPRPPPRCTGPRTR